MAGRAQAVGAPGIDSLRWLRPWYPGEELDVRVTVVSKRLSAKRKDRGYIGVELHAETDGLPLLSMEWVFIMLTKDGANAKEGCAPAPQ